MIAMIKPSMTVAVTRITGGSGRTTATAERGTASVAMGLAPIWKALFHEHRENVDGG